MTAFYEDLIRFWYFCWVLYRVYFRIEEVQLSVPKMRVKYDSFSRSAISCSLNMRSCPSGVISPTCRRFSSPLITIECVRN